MWQVMVYFTEGGCESEWCATETDARNRAREVVRNGLEHVGSIWGPSQIQRVDWVEVDTRAADRT